MSTSPLPDGRKRSIAGLILLIVLGLGTFPLYWVAIAGFISLVRESNQVSAQYYQRRHWCKENVTKMTQDEFLACMEKAK